VSPVAVTRTYLQLLAPGALRGARLDDPSLSLEHLDPCPVAASRRLYREVGAAWHWRDREAWSDDRYAAYLGQAGVSTWVLRRGGEVAGFFELAGQADGSVEIALLGLRPGFEGRGLGRHLLTCAVEAAWRAGANRVWLHTCTLDSAAALPNYLARGFSPYREERYEVED
jgi:GNAT superfamily N-acetyltransferase